MNDKTRIAIVGLGGISRLMHLPNAKNSTRVELVAVCDALPGKAEATAREFDVPRWYERTGDMYAAETLDAVIIATPNRTHHDLAIEAMRAGLPVLCEKPIALTSPDAAEMIAVSQETGKVFMADLQERFWQESLMLKRFIDAGDLGHIYYGEAVWLRRRGMPPAPVYYRKEIAGGGPLFDLGVHAIDLVWWWMGNPQPVSVAAVTFNDLAHRADLCPPAHEGFVLEDYTVEDMAVGYIRFTNGALLNVKTSWMSEIAKSSPHIVLGDRGGAEFAPRDKFALHTQMHGGLVDIIPVIPENQPRRHLVLLDHFADCVQGVAEPIITLGQMLMGIRILEAMYRSAEEGREVVLDVR